MFSTQSVVDVTKAACSQLIAKGFSGLSDTYAELSYLDDHLIADLGEALTLSGDDFAINSPADLMFKALISQCGKIAIDNRAYVAQLPSLFVDAMNWGLFREQVMIELSDVMVDEMWNPDGFIGWTETRTIGGVPVTGPEEGARIAAIEFGCYKPPVSAKLYKKAKGIMAALTTAREQFFTAFNSYDEYSAFVAGLYNSVSNSLQVKAEVYALMTVSMGIAKATANGNLISLRDEFAAVTSVSPLPNDNDALLHMEEFQRFMLMRIAETEDYIQRFTAAYNDHSHVTFAAEPQKIMLAHAVNAAKFGVRANTFNEQLLGIGKYDKVSSWQAVIASGVTDPYTLDVADSIYLTAAAASEAGITTTTGDAVIVDSDTGNAELHGIIAVIYDRYAMGVTLDKRKVTTQYSASRDTVNSFYHSLVNYIVNDNYPIVAFTLDSLT